MKLRSAIFFCTVAIGLTTVGCKKEKINELVKWVPNDPTVSANIKLINTYAWLLPSFTTTNPALTAGQHAYLYRDTFKLNGNPNSYAGVWPGPAPYSLNPAGTFNFRIVWAKQLAGVPKPVAGDTIVTKSVKLDPGKYYSFFFTDSLANPDLVVINDEYVTNPPTGTYRIRFGNFLPNVRDTVSIFSRKEKRVIFTDVLYKSVTPFIQLKVQLTADTFDVQRRGVGENPYTLPVPPLTNVRLSYAFFLPVELRSYTLYTRGNPRLRTGALPNQRLERPPEIVVYTNR